MASLADLGNYAFLAPSVPAPLRVPAAAQVSRYDQSRNSVEACGRPSSAASASSVALGVTAAAAVLLASRISNNAWRGSLMQRRAAKRRPTGASRSRKASPRSPTRAPASAPVATPTAVQSRTPASTPVAAPSSSSALEPEAAASSPSVAVKMKPSTPASEPVAAVKPPAPAARAPAKTVPAADPAADDRMTVEKAYMKPSTFARGLLGGQGAFAKADYNFDPLGLSEKFPDALPFFRESELKHGRVAMLAFVGMIAPDIGFKLPFLPEKCANAGFEEEAYFPRTVQAHDLCVGDEDGPGPLWIVLIGAGLIEIVTTAQKVVLGWGLTLENAGDYPGRKEIGDFLKQTPKREEQLTVLRLNELKHGRLAMLAFSAAITQATLSGHGFPWMY